MPGQPSFTELEAVADRPALKRTADTLLADPRLTEIVRADAAQAALELGLDPEGARKLYRAMVATSINVALVAALEGKK